MNRDTIVFSVCSFLLGLTIGSLLIGPHLKRFGGAPRPSAASEGIAAEGGGAPQGTPMESVRAQIAQLNATIERDPKNFEALAQLGGMYMDAAKYPQAIGYFERALAVRDDPGIRTDLGICYRQSGQLDRALASFQKASADAPNDWQPLYNEVAVLGEMKRFTEARAMLPRLQQLRPGDPDVQRMASALNANP